MHLYFGQCPERTQVGVLTGWCPGIRRPGNPGGEIVQLVHCMTRREQPAGQFSKIEPLERRILESSVVQVETVYINSGSHGIPQKSKGHSEERPLSRQHAASGYLYIIYGGGDPLTRIILLAPCWSSGCARKNQNSPRWILALAQSPGTTPTTSGRPIVDRPGVVTERAALAASERGLDFAEDG